MRSALLLGCVLVLLPVGAPAAAAPGDCGALLALRLTATRIATAESVPAGPFSPPVGRQLITAAFCRVAGVIQPSADSSIRFEVWMPAAAWNGRFLGVGNGGFAGEISYDTMALALARGYATASTDTGHQGSSSRGPSFADASWAVGHPERVVDFGYRAIHETAVVAKAVIRAFYAEAPKRSYFSSCSNGGRQALMEAQRFPDDYDGILAGAPAHNFTKLLANGTRNVKALAQDGAYIPVTKLPAIQSAAVAACDAGDGVKDGTIENPAACRLDPLALLCQGVDTPSCLTAPQVKALAGLYAGSSRTGDEKYFPGYSPGGEAEAGGWGPWIVGPAPNQSLFHAFGTQFFGSMLYGDPAWDVARFDFERDSTAADQKLGPILNATDPDMRRFKDRGGKLILWHGWSDAAIPAASTIEYYENVVKTMGRQEAERFVRLFMVPGMQHCAGGSGATSFGQLLPAAARDPERDVMVALERWVEQGVPPQRLVAVKHEDPADPKSEVVRSRPLCPYPLVAVYKGAGSTDDAGSFACAAPGHKIP